MAGSADSIHIGSLHSFGAWAELSDKRGWGPLHRYVEPERAALLWFRLRYEPDTIEAFPFGKWGAVQHLEELLNQALEAA